VGSHGAAGIRLKAAIFKSFRCYRGEIRIEVDDLTTFVGRTDIGNPLHPPGSLPVAKRLLDCGQCLDAAMKLSD